MALAHVFLFFWTRFSHSYRRWDAGSAVTFGSIDDVYAPIPSSPAAVLPTSVDFHCSINHTCIEDSDAASSKVSFGKGPTPVIIHCPSHANTVFYSTSQCRTAWRIYSAKNRRCYQPSMLSFPFQHNKNLFRYKKVLAGVKNEKHIPEAATDKSIKTIIVPVAIPGCQCGCVCFYSHLLSAFLSFP
jgi:hypothetical protein